MTSNAAPSLDENNNAMLTTYNNIVRGREILEYFDHEVVLYAYCNEIKDGDQCWDLLNVAREKFFENLNDDVYYNGKYHAVAFLIESGNKNQVRKLLADGTIFCHKGNGELTQPLKGMVYSDPRTPNNSMRKGLLEGSLDRVKEVSKAMAKRGLDKQQLTNTSGFLSPFYIGKVTPYCYDVTFRNVQDLMIKWSIAKGEMVLAIILMDVSPPVGTIYNFYLGSLYLAYLVEDNNKLKDIGSMVDCDSVDSKYKDECTKLQDYSQNPDNKNSPCKTFSSISAIYYSATAKDDKGDVKDSFFKFDRKNIPNVQYLDASSVDVLKRQILTTSLLRMTINADNKKNTTIGM
ncbi:hypothetical protein IWQ61_009446 [Dispira simplex]|nr:hypothetical protein IWQ61_009446 [Dispira simplex]